jgi:hypothetical protein
VWDPVLTARATAILSRSVLPELADTSPASTPRPAATTYHDGGGVCPGRGRVSVMLDVGAHAGWFGLVAASLGHHAVSGRYAASIF